MSVSELENRDDSSFIKRGGILKYLHILGDKLSIKNSIKDNNNTKFKFHFISKINHSDIIDKTYETSTCAFRARFNEVEKDDNKIFVSVDDDNNKFNESQLKNKSIMSNCIKINPNLKYNPTFLNDDGIFNKLDDRYSYTENDFRSIDGENLNKTENVSALQCKHKCDLDENCKEFLFQLNKVGNTNFNNRHNGQCILLNHEEKELTNKWNPNSSKIGYTSFSKIEEQQTILSIPEETRTTFPFVLITEDDSCTHNANTCEDKNYCKKIGDRCLRKCNVDLATGISDGLSSADIDIRCIGTLNDFNIRFTEIERNLGEDVVQKSVLINVTAEFKNKSKLLHHPILNLQGGFKVMFKCLGDSAKSSNEFVEVIDYKYDYDNHKLNEFRISNIGTNLNIPLPNSITQCVEQGNNFVLSVQIVDIHGITNVHPVVPIESNNTEQEKIRLAIQEGNFNDKINDLYSLNLKINQILNNFKLP